MSEPIRFQITPPPLHEQTSGRKTPETRLLFICQAEGLQSRYSELSSEDSGLTALGWEQTNSLARWIATHEKIDILLSAPQLRSRLTAQRLGQVLGKAVMIAPELPSHSRIGVDASSERQQLFAPLHRHEQFASEEKYHQFQEQLTTALQKLVHEHWGKTICVVVDGNAVSAILSTFCQTQGLAFSINHTAISEVAWHGGEWCIVYVNRLEHRPVPVLPSAANPAATVAATEEESEEEDMSQLLAVYNRVLSADVDLHDQTHTQRLQHLLKFAALETGLRIMDVGTGTGRLALLLAEAGAKEVVGIDISPAMLEIAEYFRLSSSSPAAKQVSFRLAAAQRVPFRGESFDAIICRLVIHHSHKPERIFQELVRLLKPGGILIFADLLGADDPVKRATQNTIEERRNPSHVAALSAEQYRKFIAAAGLQIEQESVSVFEQDLEEWLGALQSNPASRSVVREMMEAGLETDAAGLNVRRHSGKLVFDQQMIYLKARKVATGTAS
ncbi:MAG: methyltransferase domain-containing protein [Caldilineaceae bacterium]|nr:methyltransferase domain-containing protein [Caldilineaceae bacterium]